MRGWNRTCWEIVRCVQEIRQRQGDHMATTATVPLMHLEDPLAYLPCSRVLEYFKGQIVYTQQPASSLYLIIEGKVKVSRISNDGQRIVLDVYRTDEFF